MPSRPSRPLSRSCHDRLDIDAGAKMIRLPQKVRVPPDTHVRGLLIQRHRADSRQGQGQHNSVPRRGLDESWAIGAGNGATTDVDSEPLKAILIFSGIGLLLSLIAIQAYGLDFSVGFF
jgi:hypothetical protein